MEGDGERVGSERLVTELQLRTRTQEDKTKTTFYFYLLYPRVLCLFIFLALYYSVVDAVWFRLDRTQEEVSL